MSEMIVSLQSRLNPYKAITYLYSDGQHALISGENGLLKIAEVTDSTFRATIKWYDGRTDTVAVIDTNATDWFQTLVGMVNSVKPTQFR